MAWLAASLLLHLLIVTVQQLGSSSSHFLKNGVLDTFNTHAMMRHAALAQSGPMAGMLQSDVTAEKSRRGCLCETSVFSFWP